MRLLAAALAALTVISPHSLADTLHVDAALGSGANDGSSWADAFQGPGGLQAALAAAEDGDFVFVAEGTYLASSTGDRSDSFRMQTGVKIYGGFAGGESSPAERPPLGSAPSVLDGDLNGDDAAGLFDDNSYHVVNGTGAMLTALLDGFTITGGNANGSAPFDRNGGGFICTNRRPSIQNCHFVANRAQANGGGVYLLSCWPRFYGCVFSANEAGASGGGAYLDGTRAARFDRCAFTDNEATAGGGMELFATEEDVEIANCIFYRNVATDFGGGAILDSFNPGTEIDNCTIVGNEGGSVRGFSGNPRVHNCVVWNNTGGAIQTSAVSYSIVEGGHAGPGNLSADPLFVDATAGDLRLTLASPAIDAGDNALVPTWSSLDLADAPRFSDEPDVADTGVGAAPIVDMGAYESTIEVTASFCLSAPNSAGPGAVMGSTGSTSIAGNSFELSTSGVVPSAFGLYYYGPTQIQTPFGDGVRCVGAGGAGTFRLYPLVQADGSGNTNRALDLPAHPTGSGPGAIEAGSTWNFQLWYRDGAAGGTGFNASDGLSVTFAP